MSWKASENAARSNNPWVIVKMGIDRNERKIGESECGRVEDFGILNIERGLLK